MKNLFLIMHTLKNGTEQFSFINAVRSNKDLMSIHCRC